MNVTAFFHVYGNGEWEEPLEEFAQAMRDRLPGVKVLLGVVATSAAAQVRICERWDEVHGRPAHIAASAPDGFEQVTIHRVREWALTGGGGVLYAHTKGAAHATEHNRRWRRAMIDAVVNPAAVAHLSRFEAVGPFWIRDWPDEGNRFFGGNFWLARCSYLRKLPVCSDEHRWSPESWIGLGDPRVRDVLPGVPDREFFGLDD